MSRFKKSVKKQRAIKKISLLYVPHRKIREKSVNNQNNQMAFPPFTQTSLKRARFSS